MAKYSNYGQEAALRKYQSRIKRLERKVKKGEKLGYWEYQDYTFDRFTRNIKFRPSAPGDTLKGLIALICLLVGPFLIMWLFGFIVG